MTRRTRDPLLAAVQSYFDGYLRRVRGASEHTIRTYSHGLRLFFLFVADQHRQSVANLRVEHIHADVVLDFLSHVESARGNGVSTRNSRLAAIRSFVEHLLRNDVTHAEQYGRILAIPTKRTAPRPAVYLEPEEAQAVLAAVDIGTVMGRRDYAMLLFLYNTGARVSELLSVRPKNLWLQRPRQVRLFGKGRKERFCPLWPETATALRHLLRDNHATDDDVVFQNARKEPLSRDGVAYVLEKYVHRAAAVVPSLGRCHVTPHVLRHSCAVALLQSGVDVSVIRDYLGHASVATTSRYLTSNLQTKRDVLDAFWKRAGLDDRPRTRWRPSSKLLDYLSSL
jgi:site-specific recombinase XerD